MRDDSGMLHVVNNDRDERQQEETESQNDFLTNKTPCMCSPVLAD